MPITQSMLAQLLSANQESGAKIAAETMAAKGRGEQEAALRKYLQAKEPEVAGQQQTAQNEANLKTMQDPRLQALVNNGGSVKVGDLSAGADPYAHMATKQASGDAAARLKANQTYNQGVTKLQGVAQAASEGMDAINDPQNIGSLGQARTLMLKSMGMNRYNEQEAKAVLPPTLYGYASSLFNQAGMDNTPLNSVQRSNINRFFKGQLDNTATQHKMLKQNAMNVYSTSPYASQQGLQTMSALGAPMDDYLAQSASKYKDVPQTQGPNLTSQPQPGVLDRLKSFFGGGASSQQSQPQSGAHPQDNDAVQWAKSNPNDPRAATILQLNGAQ